MSKQANPRLIGAFVVASVVLIVVIVALIGSFRAFKSHQTFVIYFPNSVNNLNVGAKVKWKGVPVGQVSDIRIHWNQDVLSAEVPVFVDIDLDRLGTELDDPKVLHREVADGLRARLQLESIISGMLYVELNYVPDAAAPTYVEKTPDLPEIPTAPSPLDAIGDLAYKIAYNISNVDFKRISDNLNLSLEHLNKVMDDIDAAGMSRSVKSAANSITSLAGSPKVVELLENASQTLASIHALSDQLNSTSKPLPGQIQMLSEQATKTLKSVQEASDQIKASSADNSETITQLNETLRQLTEAARSARELADFLERNPNAFISGRQPAKQNK